MYLYYVFDSRVNIIKFISFWSLIYFILFIFNRNGIFDDFNSSDSNTLENTRTIEEKRELKVIPEITDSKLKIFTLIALVVFRSI